jgi:hypothetical protein
MSRVDGLSSIVVGVLGLFGIGSGVLDKKMPGWAMVDCIICRITREVFSPVLTVIATALPSFSMLKFFHSNEVLFGICYLTFDAIAS